MHTYNLNGHVFRLREAFDFAFIADYGHVFQVFDQQDSGNLCFGVQGTRGRLFLKLAGAATERSEHVDPQEAIARLKATLPIYEALRHPSLISLIEHCPVPGGYLTVSEWFDGTCMGKQYGQFERFLSLPPAEKLAIYSAALDFHVHAQRLGFLAIDFYDGCILYDFEGRSMRLCDIEFYRRLPSQNEQGRMWGSGRYMSPEEFTLGAPLDARTNVFTMGALAFQLMGGGLDHAREKWILNDATFAAACTATSPDPEERYANLDLYAKAWQQALANV